MVRAISPLMALLATGKAGFPVGIRPDGLWFPTKTTLAVFLRLGALAMVRGALI
jgi:hypothetical protein